MRCCYSCIYWERASRKIPIDAKKIFYRDKKIVISFGERIVEIPEWEWVPKDQRQFEMAKYMRICFYGKGLVLAWDECENFIPKKKVNVLCNIESCPYSAVCPKFKLQRSFYT